MKNSYWVIFSDDTFIGSNAGIYAYEIKLLDLTWIDSTCNQILARDKGLPLDKDTWCHTYLGPPSLKWFTVAFSYETLGHHKRGSQWVRVQGHNGLGFTIHSGSGFKVHNGLGFTVGQGSWFTLGQDSWFTMGQGSWFTMGQGSQFTVQTGSRLTSKKILSWLKYNKFWIKHAMWSNKLAHRNVWYE